MSETSEKFDCSILPVGQGKVAYNGSSNKTMEVWNKSICRSYMAFLIMNLDLKLVFSFEITSHRTLG